VFENLLGQDEAAGRLKADLEAASLPPSLLFAGPPASGKQSAALELARVLSCERGPLGLPPGPAPWNCPCPSCSRHRVLAHPDLLLLGPRSFPEEIQAGLGLLERAPGRASAFFFVRAARKLGKRFDAALYEGEESRLSKALPLLREIEERLDAVAPERAEAGSLAPGAVEAARAAAQAARKLEGLVPDAPPVFQVRSAETWARLAPNGRKKTIVVENADRMAEAARNALLKILEEPPQSVEFILLSARPSALIATVLSRVRPYVFKERSPAEARLVLDRVFKLGQGAPAAAEAAAPGAAGGAQAGAAAGGPGGSAPPAPTGVAAYLASLRAFPPEAARARAGDFLAAALALRASRGPLEGGLAACAAGLSAQGEAPGPAEALQGLLEATKDFGQKDEAYEGSFDAFLAALAGRFGELLREPGLDAAGLLLVEGWTALAREARSRRATYNLSPSLLAESLLYAMGDR